MRTGLHAEISVIRGHRDWKTSLLVALFPRQFNSFVNSHLSRAFEVGELQSAPLHILSHYVAADCGLPGHGYPPWYLKDKYGWPIEFISGRGRVHRAIRILFQNIRKITG